MENEKGLKKVETSEIVSTQNPTPEQLISQAIVNNVPVETLERLMTLRDKLKAEKAKEAYFDALSNFQAECPEIEKTKQVKNSGGTLLYKYAPLDVVVKQVKDVLKENGFSYSFQTEVTDTKVAVICEARHKMGHTETSKLESDMSTRTSIMSAPQQVAATTTFLKRYAFCNVFGIMTADEDVDGKDLDGKKNAPSAPAKETPIHFITDFQKNKIDKLITELGSDMKETKEKIIAAYKVESFEKLEVNQASKVVETLEKKIAAKKAKEAPKTQSKKCYNCQKDVTGPDAFCDDKCKKEYWEKQGDKNPYKKKALPFASK